MKTTKNFLAATVAVAALNVALAADASGNDALRHSPRYLEEHPELLRAPSASREARPFYPKRSVEMAVNTALANRPRFREEHPEFRFAPASGQQTIVAQPHEIERLRRLTENKALAASPRFREQQPELLRGGPSFEIAPLK